MLEKHSKKKEKLLHVVNLITSNPFQVSWLMQERDILIKSEERALDEVRNMSEQVHRLQVV